MVEGAGEAVQNAEPQEPNPTKRYLEKSVQVLAEGVLTISYLLVLTITILGSYFSDFLILFVLHLTLANHIAEYPIISSLYDKGLIGIAFLAVIGAIIHSFCSLLSLFQSELNTFTDAD